VGLHQCPPEKTGHAEPGRGGSVPPHVPTHTQTAAKARHFARAAPLSTGDTDSPLEEAGFELLVPSRQRVALGGNKGSNSVGDANLFHNLNGFSGDLVSCRVPCPADAG
jgi:hypothetical protein